MQYWEHRFRNFRAFCSTYTHCRESDKLGPKFQSRWAESADRNCQSLWKEVTSFADPEVSGILGRLSAAATHHEDITDIFREIEDHYKTWKLVAPPEAPQKPVEATVDDVTGAGQDATGPDVGAEDKSAGQSPTELATTSSPSPLEKFEQAVPPFDADSGDWVKSTALKRHGETAATSSLKSQRSRGAKLKEGAFGVDDAGRIWRKDSGRVHYLRASLLPEREDANPLIREANRLINKVG